MKSKRILAFMLSVAMILSLVPTFTLTVLADETQTTTTEKNIMPGTSALKGKQQSNVWFGNYQQSSLGNTEPTTGTEGVDWIESTTATQKNQGPYYKVEPIKWRVLDVDNDYDRNAVEGETDTTRSLFLLSDQNLDVFQYHTVYEGVTWAESTMRSWLNGYDGKTENQTNKQNNNYSKDNFIGSDFSAVEQNAIVKTKQVEILTLIIPRPAEMIQKIKYSYCLLRKQRTLLMDLMLPRITMTEKEHHTIPLM